MKSLRTPDSQFENLPDYPFAPHYTEIDDGQGGTLRIHHVDEGPRDAPVVLCMHGQPKVAPHGSGCSNRRATHHMGMA